MRVDPSRAAEAREVIAEWEKLQPVDPIAVPVTETSRFKSPLWFIFGILVGATLVYLHFYRAYGLKNEYDRNHDGRMDARWTVDWQGYWDHYEEDNNFDGRFEWQFEVEGDGFYNRAVLDADGDGRPELACDTTRTGSRNCRTPPNSTHTARRYSRFKGRRKIHHSR